MKKLLITTTLLAMLFSCARPVNEESLIVENDLVYESGSQIPYTGKVLSKYPDGDLKLKGTYKNGLRSGLWVYQVRGRKDSRYEILYLDGKADSTVFIQNGSRWVGRQVSYNPDSSMGDGTFLVQERKKYDFRYVPNVYATLVSNMANGLVTRWYPNGQIYVEGNFINGERNGLLTWWYQTGQKKEEAYFKMGKQDSIVTQWYDNGQEYAIGNYKNDKLHGLLTWWYQGGNKKEEATFNYGKREGQATWWYMDGQKKAEGNIINENGTITFYTKDQTKSKTMSVTGNDILCADGTIFLNINRVSRSDNLGFIDGNCDCEDCSDEEND